MNFLQRAVAGLESQIDQVLLQDPNHEVVTVTPPAPAPAMKIQEKVVEKEKERDKSPAGKDVRTSSPAPGSGRISMQERLAAAMAGKNAVRSVSPNVRASSPLQSSTPAALDDVEIATTTTTSTISAPASIIDSQVGQEVQIEDGKDLSVDVEEAVIGKVEKNDVKIDTDEGDHQMCPNGVMKEDDEKAEDLSIQKQEDNDLSRSIPIVTISDDSVESRAQSTPATTPRISFDSASPRTSIDAPSVASVSLIEPPASATTNLSTIQHLYKDIPPEEFELTITQLRADLLLCESRRAEENQASSERIDTLEEKIKYLAREAAEESRRRTASSSTPLEREVARRDERIALLMEEGEKLSKQELKHMTNLKKLRQKAQDDEKMLAEARRRQEKAEKEASEAKDKMFKATDAEKRALDRVRAMNKLEVDCDGMRRERDIEQMNAKSLKEELAAAIIRAEDAENRVQTEALEAERKINQELKDMVERLQNEAMSNGERFSNEVRTLRSKMEREADRARAREQELQGELSMLENKTEVLRTRAEEVSTGASGDAHAKLLRQMEMLQSQYAIASGNWQGMETSLLSRVAAVEKERDDLSKKEADIRKKAREINLKSKRLEVDLEASNMKLKDLETDNTSHEDQLYMSKQHALDLEGQVSLLKKDMEKERTLAKRELNTKLEEERLKWDQEHSRSLSPTRPLSIKRKSSITSDTAPPQFASLQRQRMPSRSASVERTFPHPLDTSTATSARRPTFPSNNMSNPYSGIHSPYSITSPGFFIGGGGRQESVSSFQQLPTIHSNLSHASSINNDHDENNTETHSVSSPNEAKNFNDMLSASVTSGAGPSVQLVERMSAAVRRLESEMAAARDELTRMLAQRDEARTEVVSLMEEVEVKRKVESRCEELEEEVKRLDKVHQTTLELLGERSEEVEELRNDVQDLKQMYRDLIITQTGKAG